MVLGTHNKEKIIFFLILLLGVFLIFFRLTRGDFTSDDAHYSFRSIDYVDFLSSQNQTTPLQWFGEIPGWSKWSFHDAPPFSFLVQHVFFKVFGVNGLVARLPSALAGVLSLVFVYLLGKELYSKHVGLVSMFVLALSSYFIWISRIAYLEGLELTLILGSLYFFVKSKTNSKYLYWWGVCLGLAFLTKYTSFYLIPVFAIWIMWQRRDVLKRSRIWKFLGSIALILILFSPVVVYNIMMYKARGHFDMQFAILFGQSMADWPIIERSVGSGFIRNAKNTLLTLHNSISLPITILFSGSFLYVAYEAIRKRIEAHIQVILNIVFLSLLFFLIAPTARYAPLYTPFVALAIGYTVWRLWSFVTSQRKKTKTLFPEQGRRITFLSTLMKPFDFATLRSGNNNRYSTAFIVVASLLSGYQLAYAINTNHLTTPFGKAPLWHSPSRIENLGYQQLDDYVSGLLKNVRPSRAITFSDYHHIPSTLEKAGRVVGNDKLKEFSSLIVYDENMNWFGRFWALERWMKLNYVPVLSLENTLKQARESRRLYTEVGTDSAYLIIPLGKNTVPTEEKEYEDFGSRLLEYFVKNQSQPVEVIKSPTGEGAFAVYFVKPLWKTLDRVFPAEAKQ